MTWFKAQVVKSRPKGEVIKPNFKPNFQEHDECVTCMNSTTLKLQMLAQLSQFFPKPRWVHGPMQKYKHACTKFHVFNLKMLGYKHACMIYATIQHYKPYLGSNLQQSSKSCKK